MYYPVVVEVKSLTGETLERHIVPAGATVETSCGLCRPPAVLRDTVVANRFVPSDRILFLHVRPAESHRVWAIPHRLLRLVDGPDQEWGRNGRWWSRRARADRGGTALDRVAEYLRLYPWLRRPPLSLTRDEMVQIRRALGVGEMLPASPARWKPRAQLTLW